jgi:tetratricopeptide (TPR) repeat protein
VNRKERRAQRKQAKAAPFRREGLAPGALSGNLYADAARHYHAGQLDEAERLCRDALMFDRGNSAALHLLGMLAAHAGNFEGAAEIMRQSLAINDHNPDCHFQLADVLRRLDQNFDAAAHLVRAIEIKPDFVDAHIKLGDTFAARNDPGQARACYERGLALDPNRLDAQYGLANVAIMQGRPDEAGQTLSRRLLRTWHRARFAGRVAAGRTAVSAGAGSPAHSRRCLPLPWARLVDARRNHGGARNGQEGAGDPRNVGGAGTLRAVRHRAARLAAGRGPASVVCACGIGRLEQPRGPVRAVYTPAASRNVSRHRAYRISRKPLTSSTTSPVATPANTERRASR